MISMSLFKLLKKSLFSIKTYKYVTRPQILLDTVLKKMLFAINALFDVTLKGTNFNL